MVSQQSLTELFSQQHNWQDRYRQLILLAKQLPDFPPDQKTEGNQVNGCENRVWLTYQKQADGTFIFQGDSEGRIVKGLLAILILIANNKNATQIHAIDFPALFKELKIAQELSQSRQQGLAKLIERIESIK
ncbi:MULTISPECIES: cysteine desulfurase sulfur acceptor subunit CsdE [unclassified Gilliamella]|uniref:cysteine desulfurase sulfur acceptor subunit CsdE n=1 Tax=unclassified Gilliamella TaxID=2685620 RepID=UPI00226A787F|nr:MULTISPECIES: cysteine desulfurase sulfur acceptor subunit CsdE [unclassified Gilliamella]MCX8602168.1 cysteine desulfurase sulfur acceptor subunit CsdE [Gilliamella sp. B3722]MCX8611359.1 cysteine desulfurase sulfur acceptor subunit CsdE [Gilliamella sp. B3891]MCX8613811.1 cysteine desulfurase sulfur acceptor subunit CsdE [Gilliamella sp. B3773]MCX8615105.1 cysteine desulfurase sulfur acceptor subunit CsdE [Gilliamella sp. B3770]MCX8620987.1 cysteine desulfurase sulfur acceptor subunit Csd